VIVSSKNQKTWLYKGESLELEVAVVDGLPGVTWTVDGGATFGTVTADGVYTAPLTIPDGPAIVRATSTEDTRGTDSISLRVLVGANVLTVGNNLAVSPSQVIANTFSGGQRSVVSSGSTVYAVWNDDHTGDQNVYLAISQDRGDSFSSPIRVNDDATTAPQIGPSIAVDAFGRAVIAWIDARNDLAPGFDVYVAGATIDANGAATIGANQRVTTSGPVCYPDSFTNPCDPSVALAVSAVGEAYVAWTDRSNGIDMDVLLTKGTRLISGGLFQFAPATPVHSYAPAHQTRPSVAVDGDGNVLVAWNDPRFGDQDVYWSRGKFSATGSVTWARQDVRVNTETAGDQVSPSVAVDQAGVAYVAWGQQVGISLERRKLYFAKESSARDLTVQGNLEVLPLVPADQNFPSLAVSGTNVTIAFADNRGCPTCALDALDPEGTGPTDVYIVRSTDGGTNFRDSFRINDDAVGAALHGRPSLAVDDAGRAYMVWADGRNAVSPQQAQAYFARVE
jgi:hypothetical protein